MERRRGRPGNRDARRDNNDEGREEEFERRELELRIREQQLMTATLNFEDVKSVVGKFSGDDFCSVHKWIIDFEEFARMTGWPELQKYFWAKRLLEGSAKAIIQYEDGVVSWEQIKAVLTNEFKETLNSAQVHLRMGNRVKKDCETAKQYFIAMKELGSRSNLDLGAIIQYVINGIKDEEINKVMLYGATNSKHFNEKLEVYELINNKSKLAIMNNKVNESKPQKSEFKMTRNMGTFKREHPYSRPKLQNNSVKCFGCGEPDHMIKDCVNFKNLGPKCFKCNMYGHYANDCLRNASSSKNNNQYKFEPSNNRQTNTVVNNNLTSKRNRKQVWLENKWVSAVVDTGSDINVMEYSEYQRIGSPELKPDSTSFKGVGNLLSESIGQFKTVLTWDDLEFEINVHVAEENVMPVEFILGFEFLEGLEVSFKNNTIHISKPVREVHILTKLVVDEDELDFSNISDSRYINEVMLLISNYKPNVSAESPVSMKILLHDENPVVLGSRRMPQIELDEIDRQLNNWLDEGIIRNSQSDYSSPIVLVQKKDGTKRICIDYRQLNRKIIKDRYPLPLIEDQIDKLQNAKIFSTLDLKNGFFHVPVDQASRKFTAFTTQSGHFEFCKVPFGLCNSPAVFSKFIQSIFQDLKRKGYVLTYMDDLIIPSQDEVEAIRKLKVVLEVCSRFGLIINWKKCQFLRKTIKYLGYEISDGKIKPGQEKITAVRKFPEPTTTKQLQRFLGLSGYFRKFVFNYSIIAKPLSDLLKDGVKFNFGEAQKESFDRLKKLLTDRPVLIIFRFGATTELHTDASKWGFGAILLQVDLADLKLHPVNYYSKKTTTTEQQLSSYELEVLAVVNAIKHFRVYLLGIKFKILTDCSAFQMTLNKKDISPKIARWAFLLQEFDFTIEHRPANRMKHADALSREPVTLIVVSQVHAAQLTDQKISSIMKNINNGKNENFTLENGVLFKERNGNKLLVIPKAMEFQIINAVHEKGHFGVKKVTDLIEREYYIPQVTQKIETVIKNCVSCILGNKKAGKQEGFLNSIPKDGGPLSTYHVDHIGPLATTSKKYKFILCVIDGFTKFVWLYPTKSVTAEETILKLKIQQKTFGNPKRIVSDKGSAFKANIFKEFCDEEKIEHLQIVTGVSRGNGQVERLNGIVKSGLIKLSISKPTEWYKFTDKLQMAINGTFQRSIGVTPFEILMGVKLRWIDELNLKEVIEEELLVDFIEDREKIRDEARNKIDDVQRENQKGFNKNRKRATIYKVGDLVAIKNTQFSKGKLYAPYFGPYKVIESLGKDRYNVKKMEEHNGPIITSSVVDFMKKWCDFDEKEEAEDEEDFLEDPSGSEEM